jgi:threonine dehydrogenase-like Zn-dependent dehydrogenase
MVLDGWGTPDRIGGHEWSGRVVAAGADAGVVVGDLVAGNNDTTCNACAECLAGRPSLCPNRGEVGGEGDGFQGAFARYVAAGRGAFVAVPDGVDARAAAYTEPLSVAMHAITLAGPAPGSRVLVFGAGPIGAAIIAVLRTRGIDDITAVEPGDARRRLAEQLGARARRPEELDRPGHPQSLVDEPADVVFEASGVRAAAEAGLAQLRRAGTLMIVGTGMDHPRLDTNRVLLNELVITGAFNYDANGFAAALDLMATGALPLDLLIESEPVGLDAMLDAMARLRSGETAGKVLVRPTAEEIP